MSQQHIEIIITDPHTDLITKLQELIDDGNFIRSIIQDVHSKGGHEALYVAICEKKFIKQKINETISYRKKQNSQYKREGNAVSKLPIAKGGS